MEFWKDTNSTLRHYLNADVSGIICLNKEADLADTKIKIFSELCREDISYNDYYDIITQLILFPFNHFNEQNIDYNQFQSKYF